MAFTPNIPLATDVIAQSQPLIQGNFNALVPFGYSFANFPAISSPVISGSNVGIYGAAYTPTSQSELFVKKVSGTNVPFTAIGVGSSATNGWCYTPSGLLLKWGTMPIVNGSFSGAVGTSVIVVPVNTLSGSTAPNYTTVFQTYVTPFWGGSFSNTPSIPYVIANGVTVAGNFNMFITNYTNTASAYVTYLVIGV